ncbi:MAG: hypothetical protein AUG49_19250 [Catenulispora sp. 13_1_20CM_3_70_7]|nr:MAG: hypothetical protein AUG49_19250 [Catenulispora sp. 13_1_20CM_3_70_7]
MVLLERLSEARRHGHEILAVIRGSAVNQDGASNGLSAPNGPSQQRVIRAALADAGLRPSDVDAVDAHGTGTQLGDPIEAQALLATYGQDRERPLLLGSLKSNLGHTQAAAGVGAVIKMVEAMRHKVVPGTLHVTAPSSYVDWSAGAVSLATEPVPWPGVDRPRRAGVSSFGVSGTNAHVVLEQAPEPEPVPEAAEPRSGPVPLALSARSAAALRANADRLRSFLESRSELPVADVAAELWAARSTMDHRAVVVGTDRDELVHALAGLAGDEPATGVVTGTARRSGTVFVFPGQGTQWARMGTELLRSSPVFAEAMRACDEALAPWTDYSVRDVLAEAPGAPGLERVDVVQPVLWAVMVSLAAVWRSYGVVPSAVVGHSQGEIAAACVAGALSTEDGARVVALRSRALRGLGGSGGMASVAAAADLVEERLAGWGGALSVAAVNGPLSTVVSGDAGALREFVDRCAADGLRSRIIPVDYASHSAHVEPVEDVLHSELAGIRPRQSAVPFYSTVTGDVLDTSGLDADYWYRNLRQRVRFAEVCQLLLSQGRGTFVECSPHPVLTMGIEECAERLEVDVAAIPTLRRDEGGLDALYGALARAWVHGAPVDWGTDLPRPARRLGLPTYAFQRDRFWADPAAPRAGAGDLGLVATEHPLVAAGTELAGDGGVLLSGRLSRQAQPWLADHAVSGTVLFPGTGFVELAVRAGDEVGCGRIEELTLETPLVLPADGDVRVQVRVGAADSGRRTVSVYSGAGDGGWHRHATGVLTAAAETVHEARQQWPPAGAVPVDVDGLYASLAERGYRYGPAFRGVRTAWVRGDEGFVEAALPASVAGEAERYGLHPALLDAALHGLVLSGSFPADGTWLPFSWQGVALAASGATQVRARLSPAGRDRIRVSVTDLMENPVFSAESMALRPASTAQLRTAGGLDSLYTLEWTALPPGPEAAARDGGWAVLGPDEPGWSKVLDTVGYPGLPELAAALDSGDPAPDVVVLPCRPALAGTADEARTLLHDLLDTVRSWLAEPRLAGSRLVVLTQGAADTGETAPSPAAAAVWGFVRSAREENPGRFVLGDLTEVAEQPLRRAVAAAEPEFAVRGETILVPRLVRATDSAALVPPGDGTPWRLAVSGERGSLEDLSLVPCPDVTRELEPGEVRIEVRAAGLNFRDVVVGLRMVPGQEGIGTEGAGVVVEVGSAVTDLAPGDRVMGLVAGSFGPLAVVDRRQVVPVPAGWSFECAAAVPAAFLTALYALRDVAGLSAGESVLVHAAGGGVGTAAVQLARAFGARVFATASPGKWPALGALGRRGCRVELSDW